MSDISTLAPHEWNAHRNCSGVTPTEYFSIAATPAGQATRALDPVFENADGRVSLEAVAAQGRHRQGRPAHLTVTGHSNVASD